MKLERGLTLRYGEIRARIGTAALCLAMTKLGPDLRTSVEEVRAGGSVMGLCGLDGQRVWRQEEEEESRHRLSVLQAQGRW
ncbi:hypothetical protein ZIOFF_022133 [Zingiber officinale]|uniref:Uncharacterized protein n=1 Tax=Zingiber officinale TaxID=94328 RepID=A0A8J5H2E6_ZINOF|nr:hypothetical protein ZIOFF_022133 [Zingiber officinale]